MNTSLFLQVLLFSLISTAMWAHPVDDFPTPPTPGPTPPTTQKAIYIGGGRRSEPGFGGYKVKDFSAFKKFKKNLAN
ncbi:unnamed protein product [Bursaphelenchus xylophilus]|uniref:(pine wood nematode) hypothetical protein n=1 Tax=Bursaphelenchus xylophilus TaxID=6326 RepID=A0A1I7RMQ2_BURXY|nr:unnamed protein product [Bursaphelenchus xylophilus]CAG9125590.1 unnamed protein product [Bursaphelenchus xylophilus]